MERKTGRQLMMGNEACVWAAVDAGARFYAGYPITPSTEIGNLSSKLLPTLGGYYLQMEDEISGLAAVIGASLGGMKGFTATSGPGFSLMQENIGMAIMGEIPCVIINAQRVGPSTGAATRPAQGDIVQARWGTHGGLSPIVLSAATVQECYDMTIEAFNLSEGFSMPVILLTDGVIAHLKEQLIIPPLEDIRIISRAKPRKEPKDYMTYEPNERLVPEFGDFKSKHIVKVTSIVHGYDGVSSGVSSVIEDLVNRLFNKVELFKDQLPKPKYFGIDRPNILFISYGISARSAIEVAKIINENEKTELKAGCLQLTTLWPLPEDTIKEYMNNSDIIVVPEMNLGLLYKDIERINRDNKLVPINRYDGNPISPLDIIDRLRGDGIYGA